MNAKTPDRLDVPIAAELEVQRRVLNRTDQRCVATLATLALVAIGFSSFDLGGDQHAVIDLSYPVVIETDQIGFQLDVNRADWLECSTPHY